MFISDEVRAEADLATAVNRVTALVSNSSLTRASRSAWDAAAAGVQAAPTPAPSRLAHVHWQGPMRRGALAVLILRWEATDGDSHVYPALDADINIVPDGEQAVLVGLVGVYRYPPVTSPGQPDVRISAAAAVRSLLQYLADAIGGASPPGAEDTKAAPGSVPLQ